MVEGFKTYNEIFDEADRTNSRYISYTAYKDNSNNEYNIRLPYHRDITVDKKSFAKKILNSAENGWLLIKKALETIKATPAEISYFEKVLSPNNKDNRLYAAAYSGASVEYSKIIEDFAKGKRPQDVLLNLNAQMNAAAVNGVSALIYNAYYNKTGGTMKAMGTNFENIVYQMQDKFRNGEYLIPTDLKLRSEFVDACVVNVVGNRMDLTADGAFKLKADINKNLINLNNSVLAASKK